MRHVVSCLLAVLLPTLSAAAEPAQLPALVAPSEVVAGHTQADWSRIWWQWARSFEDGDSPVADLTGELCGAKQSGSVWFLAGTYETHRTIRTCTVPAGKYLFFPLINYVVFPNCDCDEVPSCASVTASAKQVTEHVSSLVLELDGKVVTSLKRHRQATPQCFDLAAQSGGGLSPAAGNGYYVMLRPLSRGTHTLNFGGILPGMSQAVTYTLHVE